MRNHKDDDPNFKAPKIKDIKKVYKRPVKEEVIAEPEAPIIKESTIVPVIAEQIAPQGVISEQIAPQEPVIAEVPIIKESVEDSFKARREAVTEPKKAPVIEKPIPVIENLEIAEYFIEKDNTVLVNTVIIKKSVDPEVLAEQLEYLKANKIVMEKVKFIEESNLTKTSKIIHHRDLKISEVNNAIDQIEVD